MLIDKSKIVEKEYVEDFSKKLLNIKTFLNRDWNKPWFVKINWFERFQLLFEAIELYEQRHFFWVAWLIWSFNEKFIRDVLVNERFQNEKQQVTELEYLNFVSNVEKDFEDSNIDDVELIELFDKIKWDGKMYAALTEKQKQKINWIKNNTWSYNNMIKEMKIQNLITTDEFELLKNTYKNYRNCVQHWVFKRMYNQLQSDWHIQFPESITTTAISDMTVAHQISIPSDCELLRAKNIFLAFQIVTQISFDVSYMLLYKFEKDFII